MVFEKIRVVRVAAAFANKTVHVRFCPMRKQTLLLSAILFIACSVLQCSVKSLAMAKISDALTQSSGSTVFTGDNDPELIGDALPVLIKIHESLVHRQSEDAALLRATGRLCVLYAYAYIQLPAKKDRLTDAARFRHETERAKKMFLRARGYCLDALELRHPGFTDVLLQHNPDSALGMTTEADTAFLYWASMAWMGAITADKSDIGLMISMPRAVSLMDRAYSYNPDFDNGAIHEFYLSYYAGLPPSMGGSIEKAKIHFKKAVALTDGKKVGPYLSMASTVAVNTQDAALFEAMCDSAYAIDIDQYPHYRLMNTIHLRQLAWYRSNKDRFFVITSDNN